MKIADWNSMMKYLVRPSRKVLEEAAKKELGIPKDVKVEGHKILEWINFNQKAYGDNKLPMTPEERKTGESIEKSIADAGITTNTAPKNKKEPTKNKKETSWRYTSWADQQEEEKPTKKIIKKTLIAEKPKTKPVPISPFPYDWREGIWHDLEDEDPYYNWEPKEETKTKEFPKTITVKNKKLAEGIRCILNLHKRQT